MIRKLKFNSSIFTISLHLCEIPEVSSSLASYPFLFLPQNRGCLTQEKIVAGCAKHFIVIADYRYVLMSSRWFYPK